jgi:hypothetical protein
MANCITCYTLFDITQTNVLNRSKPVGDDVELWVQQRNSQCNLDTILQCISLRANPEIKKYPHKIYAKQEPNTSFGFLYELDKDLKNFWFWKFEIVINHSGVFEDEISPFGLLDQDCHEVPMLKCNTEALELPDFLDVTPEMRNIYFERE